MCILGAHLQLFQDVLACKHISKHFLNNQTKLMLWQFYLLM
jgi:hypothetical protein